MMRLAFICTEKLPVPALRGGAIQVMIEGITPFISRKCDLTIFSVCDPELPAREKREGVNYIRFARPNYVQSICRHLRNNAPFGVIHVFNRPKSVSLLKQSSPKTRFVLSLHNEMFHQKRITDIDSFRCLNSTEKIVTVSNYIASTVIDRFPQAEKIIQTVYSGADLDRFRPIWAAGEKRTELRERLGLTGKKVILFVGRLHVQKGPHVLIDAFKMIAPRYPDAALVIVGGRHFSDDTVDKYVQKLYISSKPAGDRIVFTKHMSPSDIPDCYTLADIFVCPSQWQEPLARVHYEAMSAGLPIVTTDRGGNAEVIRQGYNGIVIKNHRNPESFAKVLDLLISRPNLALKLGKNGRKLAERYFNFGRVADDLQKVYENALKGKVHQKMGEEL